MQGGIINNRYVAEATRRLNRQMMAVFTSTQVRDKWRHLVRTGVVEALVQGNTSVRKLASVGQTGKRKAWTAKDDELLTQVMCGRRGILNQKPIPANMYTIAAQRLKGRLSSPRDSTMISNRWRMMCSPMAQSRRRGCEMTPAQSAKWRTAVAKAKRTGV